MTTKLLTVRETADLLRVSEATVRSLVARKLLRHERIGTGRGQIRIPEGAIDEYRKSRTVEANAGQGATPAPARTLKPTLKHLRLD